MGATLSLSLALLQLIIVLGQFGTYLADFSRLDAAGCEGAITEEEI